PELVVQLCLQPRVGEERPAGAGEDHAELTWDEPAFGRRRVATQYRHGPGPHVLFLAHDLADTGTQVGGERLGRVFQQGRVGRGRCRCHGRRQVKEPTRVDREPAHDLQGGQSVARVGAYDPVGGVHEQSGSGPADTDVGDVHGGRGTVFERGRCGVGRRAYRLVPGALGRDVHDLTFGIA